MTLIKLYGVTMSYVRYTHVQIVFFYTLHILARHYSFYVYILQVAFWSACACHFHFTTTDLLPKSTPASSNLHIDLNLNMKFNPKTNVHDMYNVKYQQSDTLHKSVFF